MLYCIEWTHPIDPGSDLSKGCPRCHCIRFLVTEDVIVFATGEVIAEPGEVDLKRAIRVTVVEARNASEHGVTRALVEGR